MGKPRATIPPDGPPPPASALPRYPVYVPSKGRFASGLTMKMLTRDQVPFFLVVEPQEEAAYRERFPAAQLLVLPWSGDDATRQAFCAERSIENGGLIAVRNWIKEHSIAHGAARHWQLDDNIRCIYRRYQGERIYCDAGIGLRACEDFTDRYTNVALSGLNYAMFVPEGARFPPYVVNCHVYSCTLVNNAVPYRWRLAYNDDTDICLQALAGGFCTILVNAFVADKIRTMHIKGGNTTDLYQGDGRLKMARSLERLWPGVVETRRRFGRPQHMIKDAWKRFDTPLQLRPDLDRDALAANPATYGMVLTVTRDEVTSERLRKVLDAWQQRGPTPPRAEEEPTP